MEIYYESSLAHHGIKGQRWGVRRYQNYDGTYTQRGVKRYRQALDDRNEAARKEADAKLAYKTGTGSKAAYQMAKNDFKKANAKEKKAYKNLKTDKMADQGKDLYRKGHTISGNLKLNMIGQAGVVIGSRIAQALVTSKTGSEKSGYLAAGIIATGGTAVNAVIANNTYQENKRLRAYYAH